MKVPSVLYSYSVRATTLTTARMHRASQPCQESYEPFVAIWPAIQLQLQPLAFYYICAQRCVTIPLIITESDTLSQSYWSHSKSTCGRVAQPETTEFVSLHNKSWCLWEDMMSSQLCMHNSRYTQLYKTHSHTHTLTLRKHSTLTYFRKIVKTTSEKKTFLHSYKTKSQITS